MLSKNRTLIYGIDFGTSNSLLGAANSEKSFGPIALDSEAADPHVFRSLLYAAPGQKFYFGENARKAYLENSQEGRLLRSFKRFLPSKSFEHTLINGKIWRLEELIAVYLREMRKRANDHFGQDVESAVFGRPAVFSEDAESDRLAENRLRNAAELAGFKDIEFLPEPIAAAYRFRSQMQKEEIALIADFGGGTSDYTLIKLSPHEFQPEDVLSVGGVPLAGDALDGSVMKERVSKHFGSGVAYKVPMSSNTLTMPKGLISHLHSPAHIAFLNSPENREFLRQVSSWALKEKDKSAMEQLQILLENQLGFSVFEAIENGKKSLADHIKSEIKFNYPGIKIEEPFSRKHFENDSRETLDRIFSALDETLKKAKLQPSQVDRICLTGGTAKVDLIQQRLKEKFGNSKIESFRNFTSIVEGLAERAHQLAKRL